MSETAIDKLARVLEDLQRQIAALTERVTQLEPVPSAAVEAPAAAAAEPEAKPASVEHDDFSPEILLAISAAVAAYLGERAHIRAVRLIGSTRWSQEGRVSIQASHRLTRG